MSGVRQPLPWEEDQAPRKVATDLEPVTTNHEAAPHPGASDLAHRAAGDADPGKARRGATGAANRVHDWMLKNLDNPPSKQEVRERVNAARRTCANKRS